MDNQNHQPDPVPTEPTPPPYTPPYVPYRFPEPVKPAPYPTGTRELLFAMAALFGGLLLCNFTVFGGFSLGFAIAVDLCILVSAGYLMSCGHRLTPYSALLLGISLVIGAGFARSDDSFVKFVMVCFLFVSVNLGLTLLAGQQRHSAGGFLSLCDSFYTGFMHSFTRTYPAFSGLIQAIPKKDKGGKLVSVAVGLLIALPVVAVMVVLLTRADAAFEGLVNLLPKFNMVELPVTLILGAGAFCMIYFQGLSLQYREKENPPAQNIRGISPLTINTVLIAVCLLYIVYLASQLAYFTGGFAGILPQGYTLAEYARRGFFEMAALCGIDLALIGLCVGLVKKERSTPLSTRLLCLFVSAVTVFFVVTASGKMFLYMDAYGLTRLRVLTQVIMLWLGLSTVVVAVWLMVPRLPYMKTIVAAGLVIGALVLWVDVDSVVARYNVDRYLSGSMEHIDTDYLCVLNRSAVPHVARLAQQAPEDAVRQWAVEILSSDTEHMWNWTIYPNEDFRAWNYANHAADPYLPE